MYIQYSRIFKKMWKKQSTQIQKKFQERLYVLTTEYDAPILNKHSLHGQWIGCQSINVTGDIRAVFEEIADDRIEFIAIGSHSELYK